MEQEAMVMRERAISSVEEESMVWAAAQKVTLREKALDKVMLEVSAVSLPCRL